MSAIAMDTYRVVKRLVEAGFTAGQAETVTDVVRESPEFDRHSLATKTDLAALRSEMAALMTELKSDMAALRTELKSSIAGLKSDLTALESRMNARFAGVDAQFAGVEAKIEAAKADLLKWVIDIVLIRGGIVVP